VKSVDIFLKENGFLSDLCGDFLLVAADGCAKELKELFADLEVICFLAPVS